MRPLTRRRFIGCTAAASLVASPAGLFSSGASASVPLVAVAKNGTPEELVSRVVEMLGGIERFVAAGQTVLIKPNIGWDRLPEQAANTHPQVVAQMVRLCRDAGARRVRVLDRTCNQAARCYRHSGIEAAAKAAGAQVRFVVDSLFRLTPIPGGKALTEWPIYPEALESDVIINMPVAKTHSMSGVTLGMKNLMGLIGGNRGLIHEQFEEKIVDINLVIRPTLTLVDGWRVLLRNGPTGGSLDDVAEKRTIVASADIVAADAVAAGLLGFEPQQVPHLVRAHQRGLGEIRLEQMVIRQVDLGV